LSSKYKESEGRDRKIFEGFYDEMEKKWQLYLKAILFKYANSITS
jgi:hypothetical protein